MKIVNVESFYARDIVFDVPRQDLLDASNPLYITARNGQAKRVNSLLKLNQKRGLAIGVYDLVTQGYIKTDGTLNEEAFRQHDIVFFAEAHRVHEKFRPAFVRLEKALRGLDD